MPYESDYFLPEGQTIFFVNQRLLVVKTILLTFNCKDLELALTDELNIDIDGMELFQEIKMLIDIIMVNANESPNPSELLKYPLNLPKFIFSKNLETYAPNLSICLRILLTLLVSIASAERLFSKLKLIKTYLRSTMSQQRISGLALISIEHELLDQLDILDIINDFASVKARKIKF